MYKQIILSKIFDYCKKIGYPVKKTGSIVMLACPYCGGEDLTASVIPNTNTINCLKCSKKFNLIDLVKDYECKNGTEEEILEYLKDLLELDVQTKKEQDEIIQLLDRYYKENFCLVPLAKKDKNPIQNDWTSKENRNKEEWMSWVVNGLNIGIRTGAVSNITVVDLDFLTKEEKIELVKKETTQERKAEINKKKKDLFEKLKPLIGTTWIQETQGGYHLFYKYINIPKCRLKFEDYFIDVENDGGQVVVAPAPEVAVKEDYKDEAGTTRKRIVGYASRGFINDEPIASMPEALENMLIENAPTQTYDDGKSLAENKNGNTAEVIKIDALDDGDGRNVFFTSLGGYLLKRMTPDQVEYTLHGLNHRICKTPLEGREIHAMIRSLNRYDEAFQTKLEIEILDYLKLAEQATKSDIEIAVLGGRVKGEEKKKLDETLVNLIKTRKIVQKGRSYKVISDMKWTDTITDVGIPIDFKMPYFHDYAYFNFGDLILIGAESKVGKTSLSMNFVKRFKDQGIKPYYIYSENGARFKNKALALGLQDGDFFKPETVTNSLEEIHFQKNSVTIWDWIDPPDFAKTNVYFAEICKKVEEAKCILIAFVQLKSPVKGETEPGWFAPNMIRQRPALACKYLYESSDGIMGKFKLCAVREGKVQGKTFDIPTIYDWKTQEVKRIDEVEKEEKSRD